MTQTKAELLQTRHQGDLKLGDADSSHYVGFKAPATVGTSLVWTLPAADGSSNQYLKTDGSGALSWGSDSAGMPTTGGTFTGNTIYNDGVKGIFGTSSDLQIYHTGSQSFLKNTTGGLFIDNIANISLRVADGGEDGVQINANGSVELFYDNSKKFETNSDGVKTYGDHFFVGTNGNAIWDKSADKFFHGDNVKDAYGNADDLQIYHDGSNSYIDDDGTGNLYIRGSASIELRKAGATEKMIYAEPDERVELFYDNSKKFETTSSGAKLEGNLYMDDDREIRLGDTGDFQLFHHNSSGEARIYNSNAAGISVISDLITFKNNSSNETLLTATNGGAIDLYHNNSKKLETTSGGINVTGAIQVNGAALAGGGYASVQYFTSSGTWTKPSGIKIIRVTVLGGGGGGGQDNGIYSGGGNGGGGGGLSQKTIDVTSISSETVTIGSGGTGGSSNSARVNGTSGGTSSFGSHCSATGGTGGAGHMESSGTCTAAGVGSNGNINVRGGFGGKGINPQNYSHGGDGGASPMWGVDCPGGYGTGSGVTVAYGSGGAGSPWYGATSGASGLIVVEEFK